MAYAVAVVEGLAFGAADQYLGSLIVAGILTGPLYGFLGHRWRVARSWISAVLVASALCLEPLALRVVGMLSGPPVVWWAETSIGAVVAVLFAFMIATSRRARQTVPPTA